MADSNSVSNAANPAVSIRDKGDIAYITAANRPRQQSMNGFDDEFTDIVDYIVKITHRIWEEKAVGLIYDYYLHNALIHTSSVDIYGREAIIAGTLQSLAAFPDRRLYGDEVIWKHNPGDVYYSSHRITHEGLNTGHTWYGPPTHHRIHYRAIADCIVKDNQIVEEWLVRDELLLVQQLGFDVHEVAQRAAEAEAKSGFRPPVRGEVERTQGQLPPRRMPPANSDGFDVEDFARRCWHEIWNWRLLNKVDDYFAENIVCEGASGRRISGTGDYKAYMLSLLGPFPDLMMSVDHFCANEDGHGNYRAATRWTMQGTHTGPGFYGKPAGKRVNIIGVTHQIIEQGRITREWTVFDEFALLKQLYAPD